MELVLVSWMQDSFSCRWREGRLPGGLSELFMLMFAPC